MGDPQDYRPISLLSTTHKLFARILKRRLERQLMASCEAHSSASEPRGRRHRRSCRLIESAERHGPTLYVHLLDWTALTRH